jgi:hypothetical protein
MLRSPQTVAESNDNDVIGFIAGRVETILNRLDAVESRMATKEDLARLEGRFDEKLEHLDGQFDEKLARLDGQFDEKLARLDGQFDEKLEHLDGQFDEKLARLDGRFTERLGVATTSIRGDIEQIQLRLDSMEHSIASRFENVEGELSRLRSAVYILGKDRPDVLRLLGHTNP